MRIRRQPFLLATMTLLLAIHRPALAGDPQWVDVRSPHFSVITDAGEKRGGRDVAVKFEQMRAVFGALLVKANVNLPVPLQIIAFRNTKEMRQFAPLFQGKPVQLAGLFQSGQDRNFILLDMSVEDPWTTVFHEYAHLLLNGNWVGETQPWFDEGFAEYFSTIDVDDKEARVGHKAPPGDLEVLQELGEMKVADLFRVRQDAQTYNEGDRRSIFYAESWLVVHYLYDTEQVTKLPKYFDAVFNKNVPVEDAIQQNFGITATQFDKALQNYLKAGRVAFSKIPTPPGIATTGYTVVPLSLADSKAVMADMHLHSLDYREQAVTEFLEVLKIQPGHAAALRGLGYAYLQKKDFAKAGEYFRKAAQDDSKDPRVHYYSALLMNEERVWQRDPEKIAEMRKELLATIGIDPNFADAYNLLGLTYMSSAEPEKGLEAMQKAVQLNPRNDDYLLNLSYMYLNGQRLDEGIAILRELVHSSNPEIAKHAGESLLQAEDMKAEVPPDESAQNLKQVGPDRPRDPEGEGNNSAAAAPPRNGPPAFLKGKLVSVDCSAAPAAVLSVASGGKTWKMKVADTNHAVVIGADHFSCDWANKSVALNFHESGTREGTVMSIEIQ